MLNTLLKIGEQLLEGQEIRARLTTEPKFNKNKKNWVCPILFDCLNKKIRILKDEVELFKPEKSSGEFWYVAPTIWGPRGKKCALTVEPKKFSMLEETLFGKTDEEAGSMAASIEDFDPTLKEKMIYKALHQINDNLNEQRDKLDLKNIKEELNFSKQDEVVLFYSIISSEQINEGKYTKVTSLEGYEDFIIGKFGTPEGGGPGLDYITGNTTKEAIKASFSGRYNIHKIFQTTASNYASGFSDFRKNFQSDPDTLAALDKASEYTLNNLQTQIAGVSHIIAPNFLNKDLDDFDIKATEFFLDRSSDLLFRLKELSTSTERDLPPTDLFWINYFAYESDGNSFKVINHIKDVNSRYIKKLIEIFYEAETKFGSYIGGQYEFNLQSIYYLIPIRNPTKRSKVNLVLSLFKDILEHRQVSQSQLWKHFIELILCHWYSRYKAFSNIRENKSFDFAVKDAVFKYSALIYALKQLKLIDMENKKQPTVDSVEKSGSEFQQRIENFFIKMNYSEYEEAIFYLGRVLSNIARAQYDKKHESKPVLNKINFNGMDAQAITRFSLDLAEKSRQYNIHRKTDWDFSRFRERFNEKDWPLSNEQNVFYLMVGYTFGLTKSDNN